MRSTGTCDCSVCFNFSKKKNVSLFTVWVIIHTKWHVNLFKNSAVLNEATTPSVDCWFLLLQCHQSLRHSQLRSEEPQIGMLVHYSLGFNYPWVLLNNCYFTHVLVIRPLKMYLLMCAGGHWEPRTLHWHCMMCPNPSLIWSM